MYPLNRAISKLLVDRKNCHQPVKTDLGNACYMGMKTAQDLLPAQVTGRQTDFSYDKKFDTLAAAHEAFRTAAGRLLSINNWHYYAGKGSAIFTLCNNQGEPVGIMAEAGLLISIDLPSPAANVGEGLEWVMIEELHAEGDQQSAEEYVLMTVRPIPDPRKNDPAIAHFYKEVSTSTFLVRRDGLELRAGAYGRNETPNNEDVDLHDKVRNTAIALMARIGLSGPQWQKLAEGLVEYQESQ